MGYTSSCGRTRSQQRVWFCVGNASGLFGSGIVISPGVVKELNVKTRIVSVDLNRERLAIVFRLEGGY